MMQLIRRTAAFQDMEMPEQLRSKLESMKGITRSEASALEAACYMPAWCSNRSTREIEAMTGWTGGMLTKCGESFARQVRVCSAFLRLNYPEMPGGETWNELAWRLQHGPASGTTGLEPVARYLQAGGCWIGRTMITYLMANGLPDADSIAVAGSETLVRAAGYDTKRAEKIQSAAHEVVPFKEMEARDLEMLKSGLKGTWEWIDTAHVAEEAGRYGDADLESGVGPNGKLLEIDLQSPGIVRTAGREMKLTPLCFDLLAMLAEQPGKVVTRQALYNRLWPDGGPEEEQPDAHRRSLARKLVSGLQNNPVRIKGVHIEIHRGIGARLNLLPEQITFVR
jgi:hypothetical protein